MSEMATTYQVGNRTNGLSLALQLHHPSSPISQTGGIDPWGAKLDRMTMDHAITDSHRKATPRHNRQNPRFPREGPQSLQNRPNVGTVVCSEAGCPILTPSAAFESTVSHVTLMGD